MADSIFVDTSGFYAALVRRDNKHKEAAAILAKGAMGKKQFVTSDYILDETVTLLKARGHGHLVEPFLESVLSSRACSVEWMDPQQFDETRRSMAKHSDQKWSFTDGFSFLLMQQSKLRRALTKDEHFRQAGYIPLLG
jgi:predicted nucleic acid-binding protein